MRVISAGDGYRYLLKSVAAGDGNRDLSTPLTRYYHEKGTPPGFWLGTGVADLGDDSKSRLTAGDTVTELQLQRLLGAGLDPLTGEPLGRAYPQYKTKQERIQERVDRLDPRLTAEERASVVETIAKEEEQRGSRRAVAGFDFTFSVPKSVSALWAVADGGGQTVIADAHHAAIADVMALIEREVAATRTGFNGPDGAVAQVAVTGVVATAFDHYDSRAGDPQLHTHVVISNKVRTVLDGKWRSLDGRPMHAAVVALSEHYNALLADQLTRRLGLSWEQRQRGRDRNPAWEITGVPDELIKDFSSRSAAIEVETDRLIAEYTQTHGHRSSAEIVIRLRAQATLSTRPDKEVKPLAELTERWRTRATAVLGQSAVVWARQLIGSATRTRSAGEQALARAKDFEPAQVDELAAAVVECVSDKRSTWQRWNLHAEASRQLMGTRFATTADRETAVERITTAAEAVSLRLTPPELASSPPEFRRSDQTSVFRPRQGVLYTSHALLAAEDRLLQLTRTVSAPIADPDALRTEREGSGDWGGSVLAVDQREALQQVCVSGRTVDVLVGPAGAGKTTAMRALRAAWETTHGAGSVVGLATSAGAAEVLSDDLGIPAENTAKWLFEHRAGRWDLTPGQLVIVDEASLAGTFTIDELAVHAAGVRAKLLLVGDPAQLGAVEAGGAFGLLVNDLRDRLPGGAPELTGVRRFRQPWERAASLALRRGDTSILDVYHQHHRLVGGDTEDMLDASYTAWRTDIATGKSSLMIAENHDTVTQLNARARLDRITAGHVDATRAVGLHDGTEASVGDLVVTRKNQRRLLAGRRWVKNGDRWTITATHADGSVTIRRTGATYGAIVTLPAAYVAEFLELGYASTSHRAQGATVDTAHVLVHSSSMTREAFYVAMTRGRWSNMAYVATDQTYLEDHQKPYGVPDEEITARTVLYGVLNHPGAEASAHETLQAERERWTSIAQLTAEYDTLAAAAQNHRWNTLIRRSGLEPAQADAVLASDAFGPLATELRHAEADGHDVDTLLPKLVAMPRGFADADNIAAVLHHRLTKTINRRPASRTRAAGGPRTAPQLIVGLIPEATGPMHPDMRRALDERKHLIEQRARVLAEQAVANQEPWVRELGLPPRDTRAHRTWLEHAAIVAAYRDRYQITTATPVSEKQTPVDDAGRRRDASRAQAAAAAASQISTNDRFPRESGPTAKRTGSGPRL
jgi:conjugative relaxase-like TrwC/TraI family protein